MKVKRGGEEERKLSRGGEAVERKGTMTRKESCWGMGEHEEGRRRDADEEEERRRGGGGGGGRGLEEKMTCEAGRKCCVFWSPSIS